MTLLKGLLATSVTLVVLAVFTIILLSLKMRSVGAKAATPAALWAWMVDSPLYWVLALVLVGVSYWFFRRWTFGH